MSSSSHPLVGLLGRTLQSHESNAVPTEEALSGKEVVGLYFSAHWCPPCRMFTPMLAEWYRKLMAAGKAIEMVFVSSDRDEKSFEEYFAEHPWLALPFADRDKKAQLSSKFKVSGIPTLILLDGATGEVIDAKGRNAVSNDPEGDNFPYRPKPLRELVQGPLVDRDGKQTTFDDAIKGKEYLLFYFSASWCPPCQRFTPQLASWYESFKTAGRNDVEVIFVSGDRDQESFEGYLKKHPWLAIPLEDKRIGALNAHFDVEGIPCLVVLDRDLKVVNGDAVQAVMADPEGKEFPWAPKPLTDLSMGTKSDGCDINEKPALVALIEAADDDEQAEITALLETIAKEYSEAGKASEDGPRVIFFTNKGQSRMGDKVRELTTAGDVKNSTGPVILLLDIPNRGGYYEYTKGEDFSDAALRAFLDDFHAGNLIKKQLGE